MERLRRADLTALLDASRDLLAYRTLDAFSAAAVDVVGRLVPGVRHACIVTDLRRWRVLAIAADPADAAPPDLAETAMRYAHEHPLMLHAREIRSGEVYALSDFSPRREFVRTSTYAEVYRPIGAFDLMGFVLPLSPFVTLGLGVNRGRTPFTERDRAVLGLLRPHFIAAYHAARAASAMQDSLDATERAVITFAANGCPRAVSERARTLLRAYFPRTPGGDAPPQMLADWVRRHADAARPGGDAPPVPTPLVVAGERGRLVARLVTTAQWEGGYALLLHEERNAPAAASLAPLGLSPREDEVLHLVMRGKADKEIAAALGCATRTVRKHLEHIYAKLGVQSRTAAVSRAHAACGVAEPLAS